MRTTAVAIFSFLLLVGCAGAQQNQSPPPLINPVGASASGGALQKDSSIDQVLDALDQRGKGLKGFTADVKLAETDAGSGDTAVRAGTVIYQLRPDGNARILVTFNTVARGENAKPQSEKILYLLDNGKLVDRKYRTRSESTHQIVKPGEKFNPFDLGAGGPFPLPIGQSKEDVHQSFDVTKVEPKKDDPPNTVHLKLAPKSGTRYARNIKSVDVWVDLATSMPVRIETLDNTESNIRTADLGNVKVNPDLADKDFALEKIPIDQWNITDDAFQD